MKEIQKRIQEILDEAVAAGTERGLQVCVYHRGRLLVDAWAGVYDHRSGAKVEGNTLFPVFSVGKGIAATVVHRLVERGLLHYDRPLADLWPEFGAEGKEKITLRQVLNHTSGLPYMPPGIGFSDLADWAGMCARMAGLKPVWEPGTRMEYHAVTYAWLVGEPACRATGKTFGQLLREEICQPLGLADLYMGIGEGLDDRIAWLEEPGATGRPDPGRPESIPFWLWPLHEFMNREDVRRACVPASNGIMSARAIAAHYAALLPEGCEGRRLLGGETLLRASEICRRPNAEGNPASRLLGYSLSGENPDGASHGISFGAHGYGGSMGFLHREWGLGVGIVRNRFCNSDLPARVREELLKYCRKAGEKG